MVIFMSRVSFSSKHSCVMQGKGAHLLAPVGILYCSLSPVTSDSVRFNAVGSEFDLRRRVRTSVLPGEWHAIDRYPEQVNVNFSAKMRLLLLMIQRCDFKS